MFRKHFWQGALFLALARPYPGIEARPVAQGQALSRPEPRNVRLIAVRPRGSHLVKRFVQGARPVMQQRTKQSSGLSRWLVQLTSRTHRNVAGVALANGLARMAWAVLAKNEPYRPLVLVWSSLYRFVPARCSREATPELRHNKSSLWVVACLPRLGRRIPAAIN